MHSVDSDVFLVEQLSNEPIRQRINSPNVLTLKELSGTHAGEMPTFSSVASPERNIVTLDDNSNDPPFPYGFRVQQQTVPPSRNNLNRPSNPFNMVAAQTVVQQNPTQKDHN